MPESGLACYQRFFATTGTSMQAVLPESMPAEHHTNKLKKSIGISKGSAGTRHRVTNDCNCIQTIQWIQSIRTVLETVETGGEAMSLIRRVYEELRRQILEGELQPGTRLTETGLAEIFDTSRTPVREALALLRNEGLVCHKPGEGLVVSDVSVQDIVELMGIRRVLEEYAIDQAIDNITEADLMQLELFINQSRYYLEKNDVDAIFEHNTKFHDYILEKSCNKRLQAILGNLMDPILRFRIMTLHYPGNTKDSIERHQRLVQALRDRDRDLARQIIAEDVTVGQEILLNLFDSQSKEKKEA
jgi:DNA-binding GntR family transcriptional regulator